VTPRTVDARILAATNVDLRARVAAGLFRADLFHRLNVVHLQVPALRERKEDVLHLAQLFLRRFAALHRRPAQRFTAAAEQALQEYGWPGNVRELENIVLASVLLCDASAVDVCDLQGFQGALAAHPWSEPDGPPGAAAAEARPAGDPVRRLRKALGQEIALALRSGGAPAPLGKWLTEDLVLAADRLSGGTHRRAAELLGIRKRRFGGRYAPRSTGARRPERPLGHLVSRRQRHRGSDPLTASWSGRTGLGGSLAARRDRNRRPRQCPPGGRARRCNGDNLSPAEGAGAPVLRIGAPE